MINIDNSELQRHLAKTLSYEELRKLAFDLGVDIDIMAGEGRSDKARELIAFLDRRNQLEKLHKKINLIYPSLFDDLKSTPYMKTSKNELGNLNIELISTRQVLTEAQRELQSEKSVSEQINEALQIINRAVGQSEELTARLILPAPEETDIRLVPAHIIERLEEYRSDENVIYLLIGLFGGAILGVIANWATNDENIITRASIILIVVLIFLTMLGLLWLYRVHSRYKEARVKILTPEVHRNEFKSQ